MGDGRTFTDSARNGPRRIDEGRVIMQCCDCSRFGVCEIQRKSKSKWRATTIAEDCDLPRMDTDEDG